MAYNIKSMAETNGGGGGHWNKSAHPPVGEYNLEDGPPPGK